MFALYNRGGGRDAVGGHSENVWGTTYKVVGMLQSWTWSMQKISFPVKENNLRSKNFL